MTSVSLIRIRKFSAAHRYWRAEWSSEKNLETFGEQTYRHGHNYRLEVVVTGPPAPDTGFVVPLVEWDRRLDQIVGMLHNRDLNEAIPEVSNGSMLPSTEALSQWIWRRLEGSVPGSAHLSTVRVWESDELGAQVTEAGRKTER